MKVFKDIVHCPPEADASRWLAGDCRFNSGFTLVEMVVTLILVGILATAAIPRFMGSHGFEERGFNDETMAALRYAQKAAVSHRRMVCADFTQQSVTLTIASSNPGGCDTPLLAPGATTQYQIDAATDSRYKNAAVKFSPIPTTLTFDALGQPNAATTIQVQNFSSAITVEGTTGYVH